MNVYIYFRTAPGDRQTVATGVHELMAELLHERGIRGELMLRAESDKNYMTWMEVYAGLSTDEVDTFLEHLSERVNRAGLNRLIAGDRQVERFEHLPGNDARANPENR
jgi:quinol monooxygenase YgiN